MGTRDTHNKSRKQQCMISNILVFAGLGLVPNSRKNSLEVICLQYPHLFRVAVCLGDVWELEF